MRIRTPFRSGEKVVYPMHGVGRVAKIHTRTIAGQPRRFYQIVLEDQTRGDVFVPVDNAQALGLRRPLHARQVRQTLQQLQQTASQPLKRGQGNSHYAWCKERLRQGEALGLAEVRRFLHDLEHLGSVTDLHLRLLRTYVCTQLVTEIAQALRCSRAEAERVVDLALTSRCPIAALSLPGTAEP
jgi:CarD family transcriptional regulator